jgi:hypothetical protein
MNKEQIIERERKRAEEGTKNYDKIKMILDEIEFLGARKNLFKNCLYESGGVVRLDIGFHNSGQFESFFIGDREEREKLVKSYLKGVDNQIKEQNNKLDELLKEIEHNPELLK